MLDSPDLGRVEHDVTIIEIEPGPFPAGVAWESWMGLIAIDERGVPFASIKSVGMDPGTAALIAAERGVMALAVQGEVTLPIEILLSVAGDYPELKIAIPGLEKLRAVAAAIRGSGAES